MGKVLFQLDLEKAFESTRSQGRLMVWMHQLWTFVKLFSEINYLHLFLYVIDRWCPLQDTTGDQTCNIFKGDSG